jgi:transcriptional regulator with XRE-family HTH domain
MLKKNPYFGLGFRLKNLRGKLTQKEFAKAIGISERAYQRYESGERLPSMEVLLTICSYVEVTIDELRKDIRFPLPPAIMTDIRQNTKKESNKIFPDSVNLSLFTAIVTGVEGFLLRTEIEISEKNKDLLFEYLYDSISKWCERDTKKL